MLNTSQYVGVDLRVLTDFSASIDLVALGPTGAMARYVIVLDAGSGNLTVTTAHGLRSLPADELVGIPILCGVKTINSETTAASVMVIW